MLKEQREEAQQALNELFTEGLVPFKLSARQVAPIGGDEYIVYFHDGPLHSLDISWCPGECFKDLFRTAVLQRVERMGSSLPRKLVR